MTDILKEKTDVSSEQAIANIITFWHAASDDMKRDGIRWYPDARDRIHEISLVTRMRVEIVAAVVAALSPRVQWSRNMAMAWSVCVNNDRLPGTMQRSYDKAMAVIEAAGSNGDDYLSAMGEITGPKTQSFMHNLVGDDDSVTVDVWAARAALTPGWVRGGGTYAEDVIGRVGVYDALVECYRAAAGQVGVAPCEMQATVWIAIRNGRRN